MAIIREQYSHWAISPLATKCTNLFNTCKFIYINFPPTGICLGLFYGGRCYQEENFLLLDLMHVVYKRMCFLHYQLIIHPKFLSHPCLNVLLFLMSNFFFSHKVFQVVVWCFSITYSFTLEERITSYHQCMMLINLSRKEEIYLSSAWTLKYRQKYGKSF